MKKILDPRWPQHRWHVQSGGMKILLGLRPQDPLPLEGMPARDIQGFDDDKPITIKVWVDPIRPLKFGPRRMTHRVRCECPDCGEKMSAGRLHQHRCKA